MRLSRKLNFTNRVSLDRSEIEIELKEQDGKPPRFSARFNFQKVLDPDAKLYVEAYCGDTTQRFDFGTIASPVAPENLHLDHISLSGTILFRVKVVDTKVKHGRLLALADKIRPSEPEDQLNRSSLMTIKGRDLGQQVWSMEFSEDDFPVLLINSKIPEAVSRLNTDSIFIGMIIPHALKQVLLRILFSNEDMLDDSDSWQFKWMEFVNKFAPDERPVEAEDFETHSWIDSVVEEFCERFQFCSRLTEVSEEQS